MKSLLLILLFSFTLMSCSDSNKSLNSIVSSNSNSDIPCITVSSIYFNQWNEAGRVAIAPNNLGVQISIDTLPNISVSTLHIRISPTKLNGNLAPGQFPIHIQNPTFPFVRFFTWDELDMDYSNDIYAYTHFESNIGTGWAGNFKREGRGQWYYWNYLGCN